MAGLFDTIGSFFTGGSNISGPGVAGLQEGFNLAQPNLTAGLQNVNQLYGQAIPYLQQNFQNALPGWQQVLQTGQAGTTQLENLLGIGPGGSTGALQALQATPNYNFNLKAIQDATTAGGAATGKLASGATMDALAKQASGYAGNVFQNAVSNLSQFPSMLTAGAQGLGNIFTDLGTRGANLFQNQAQQTSPFYQALAKLGFDVGAGTGAYGAQQGMVDSILGSNLLSGILGAGSNLLGGYLKSDARVKEEIAPIGKLFDGSNVYRFRYQGDSTPHIGLLAQEVERRTPDAVREFGGVKHVDYAKATAPASALAYLMAA
jgi:hypothetical protein